MADVKLQLKNGTAALTENRMKIVAVLNDSVSVAAVTTTPPNTGDKARDSGAAIAIVALVCFGLVGAAVLAASLRRRRAARGSPDLNRACDQGLPDQCTADV